MLKIRQREKLALVIISLQANISILEATVHFKPHRLNCCVQNDCVGSRGQQNCYEHKHC